MRGKVMLGLAVIVLMAGIIIIWQPIQHGLSARDNPTALETFLARTMRNLAIPSGAKNQTNQLTASPEVLVDARHHFADHCASCHANDGSGNTTIGRNLYPKAPDMRLPETQGLSDGQLYYIIHNGIRLTGMPAWGEANRKDEDKDTWELVLFIRGLPRLTPEEEKDMEQFNPKSSAERSEEKEEEDFLKGGNPPATNKHHH